MSDSESCWTCFLKLKFPWKSHQNESRSSMNPLSETGPWIAWGFVLCISACELEMFSTDCVVDLWWIMVICSVFTYHSFRTLWFSELLHFSQPITWANLLFDKEFHNPWTHTLWFWHFDGQGYQECYIQGSKWLSIDLKYAALQCDFFYVLFETLKFRWKILKQRR